jgi:uncharacterized membrane protein
VTFRPSELWSVASACLAVVTTSTVAAGVSSPLRPAFVLPFVLFLPGMSLVRLLGIRDPVTVIMLAMATSLALAAVVAGAMVYTGTWSPVGGLLGLTLLTLAANLSEVVLARLKAGA